MSSRAAARAVDRRFGDRLSTQSSLYRRLRSELGGTAGYMMSTSGPSDSGVLLGGGNSGYRPVALPELPDDSAGI